MPKIAYKVLTLILLWLCSHFHTHAHPSRYRIYENSKKGYIDSAGKIVIPCKFTEAGNFSEGLAAVRIGGCYGYINTEGKWIIPPQYDYATEFHEGFAMAWKNAVPFFINRQGNKMFEGDFKPYENFLNGIAKIRKGNYYGLINSKGDIILRPEFTSISEFTNGRAIVEVIEEFNDSDGLHDGSHIGVIDTNGKFIVPFGKYLHIGQFKYEHAIVKLPANSESKKWCLAYQYGIIDKFGNLKIFSDSSRADYLTGELSDSFLNAYTYTLHEYSEKKSIGKSKINRPITPIHEYVMEYNGHVIIDNPLYFDIEVFHNGLAVIRDSNHDTRIIDKKGNLLTNDVYSRIREDAFKFGYAIVQTEENGWGVLNTKGEYILKPEYNFIRETDWPRLLIAGSKMKQYNADTMNVRSHSERKRYGILDLNGKWRIPPRYFNLHALSTADSIFEFLVDDTYGYVKIDGTEIWRSSGVSAGLDTMDIDFMFNGNTNVSHQINLGKSASVNNNKRFFKNQEKTSPLNLLKKLEIKIDLEAKDTFEQTNAGIKVQLFNPLDKNLILPVQDNRLYMYMEARTEEGEWKAIDYMVSSNCQKSYYNLAIPRKAAWNFTYPIFKGVQKTEGRIALWLDPDTKGLKELPIKTFIYSKPFTMYVNPAQFWRVRETDLEDLMWMMNY